MSHMVKNWKKFLNERATDQLYQDILTFFISKVLKIENFEYSVASPGGPTWFYPPFEDYSNASNKKEGIDDLGDTWAAAFVLKRESWNPLWEKYKATIPGDDKVFPTKRWFIGSLANFKILLFHVDPHGRTGVGGSMSNTGEMHIIHRGKIGEDFYKDTEVFNFYKSQLIKLLDHEITHYLNASRSNWKVYRAKGGAAQFDPSKQEYVDSTEEIQARLIEAFRQFEREANAGSAYWMEQLTPTQFVEEFIAKYYAKYESDKDDRFNIKNHSKQNQKRIRKRVYEYMKSLRKKWNEELPDTEILEKVLDEIESTIITNEEAYSEKQRKWACAQMGKSRKKFKGKPKLSKKEAEKMCTDPIKEAKSLPGITNNQTEIQKSIDFNIGVVKNED